MSDRVSHQKLIQIAVSAGVLESTNISLEFLQQNLMELKGILRDRFGVIIPNKISGAPELYWIICLNQRLQSLKGCEGFAEHLSTFTHKQLRSSYFVTTIASHLLNKVDTLVLEPGMVNKDTKADILVKFNEEQIYLECKHQDTMKSDYSKEHEHVLSILKDYIQVPHQIDIRYKTSLSNEEIHLLGKTIERKASSITGDGILINTPNIEVQVTSRSSYADKRFRMVMGMIVEDLYERCKYPGHAYSANGLTLSISGPKVDQSRIIRDKLKKSRNQSPSDKPFVLIIDNNILLGDITENIRTLSTAFQPKLNTRFSAAMLVEHHPRLDKPDIDLKFHLISNPFAKFPVSKKFERLFPSSISN